MTIRSVMFVVILAPFTPVGFSQGNIDRNPLPDLSASIRELTLRASRSVVEVAVNGYGVSSDSPGRTSDQVSHQHSIGSGVLVDSSGSIMTNAHVIDGAT